MRIFLFCGVCRPGVRSVKTFSPHVRESGFRNREFLEFLLVKSGLLAFGIRNIFQEIRNPTNNWDLEFKFQRQRIGKPGVWIQNPRLCCEARVINTDLISSTYHQPCPDDLMWVHLFLGYKLTSFSKSVSLI